MPELDLSLEPHAVASLSVFYGVNSIPDELLSPSYPSQCRHLDTQLPTPAPPPTRERGGNFQGEKSGKGRANHKKKMRGRKEGNKKRRNEVCSRGGRERRKRKERASISTAKTLCLEVKAESFRACAVPSAVPTLQIHRSRRVWTLAASISTC